MDKPESVSRRALLEGTALILGSVASCGLVRPAAARQKLKKTVAQYQDHPKGIQRCEICLQFQKPSSCQLVEGQISPQGSCRIFIPIRK